MDLHSGIFGGAVANPINVLSKMIAQTVDDEGRILIPGFYDDVVEVSRKERSMMAKAPFSAEEYKRSLDVKELSGEKGIPPVSVPVFALHLTYVVYGAAILGGRGGQKLSCPQKLMPRSAHDWCPTRTTTR